MKTIMLVGDTHANLDHIEEMAIEAVRLGITDLYQLGDFGFTLTDDFFKKVTEIMSDRSLTIHWIDGNHDNHDLIRSWPTRPGESFWVSDCIEYLPRGYRWEIEGVSFLAMGGAVSIDRDRRTEGVSIWYGEHISYAEAELAVNGGHADIILSHDVPFGPLEEELNSYRVPYQEAAEGNRKTLLAIVDVVRPSLIAHGHYHYRYDRMFQGIQVSGYGMNGMGKDSFGILRLDNGSWKLV